MAIMMAAVVSLSVSSCKKDSNNSGGNSGGSNGGNGTYSGHSYVDLGLPSGTLWATCNVGADTPEGYGDYFAWGETTPKSYYYWNTYRYCSGGSGWALNKYCSNAEYGYNGFTDNLTTLLPEDDAANVNWGSGWCMATYDQWVELFNNTTLTWETQNDVYGRLFTASNGNSIFLPAAGWRIYDGSEFIGTSCIYWTSSLNTDEPDCACQFIDFKMSRIGTRDGGRSVRAVRSF